MSTFSMPSLGADMEKGTIVDWHIKEGDRVNRGDIVAEVETQKGVMEVEIWQSGMIKKICIPVGEEVPVGTPLAILEQAIEPRPADQSKVAATPLARRMAKEAQLNLSQIKGTGPHGAICRQDVETALEARNTTDHAFLSRDSIPTPKPQNRDSMRQAIARSMERSKKEIPHYAIKIDADLSKLTDTLAELNLRRLATDRILPISALVKAVALAARRTPQVNGFWRNGAFRPSQSVHVGLAISLKGGGLVAPALMHAGDKPVDVLMKEILDLVARARRGKLKISEMSESTITLTNLGDKGADEVTGIITPPQVSLVGVGRISPKPWASGNLLGVRPVATLTLVGDHRVSDGHLGSLFLRDMEHLLAHPHENGFLNIT